MKLTKDTLIEGQIVKKGTTVEIKEGYTDSGADELYKAFREFSYGFQSFYESWDKLKSIAYKQEEYTFADDIYNEVVKPLMKYKDKSLEIKMAHFSDKENDPYGFGA